MSIPISSIVPVIGNLWAAVPEAHELSIQEFGQFIKKYLINRPFVDLLTLLQRQTLYNQVHYVFC